MENTCRHECVCCISMIYHHTAIPYKNGLFTCTYVIRDILVFLAHSHWRRSLKFYECPTEKKNKVNTTWYVGMADETLVIYMEFYCPINNSSSTVCQESTPQTHTFLAGGILHAASSYKQQGSSNMFPTQVHRDRSEKSNQNSRPSRLKEVNNRLQFALKLKFMAFGIFNSCFYSSVELRVPISSRLP